MGIVGQWYLQHDLQIHFNMRNPFESDKEFIKEVSVEDNESDDKEVIKRVIAEDNQTNKWFKSFYVGTEA